jgi:biopolymer transport protein TolQ
MIVFELFWQASFLVQLVMVGLMVLSFISWTIIFEKIKNIQLREIEIIRINQAVVAQPATLENWMSLTKQEGFFSRILAKGCETITTVKHCDEKEQYQFVVDHIDVLIDSEIKVLKKKTSFLATIGSVSPYIGLFGTVWGIMHAFIAIAEAKQATLEYVAPSIAEALIATAIGLVAAIPAYIFYNIISTKIEEISEDYDILKEHFVLAARAKISKQRHSQQ